jgi:hypothetical protein
MLYVVEFFCAVLIVAGVVLFGVYCLSKILAVLLLAALIVFFVRIECLKGSFFVGGGFAFCVLIGPSAHLVALAWNAVF